MQGTRSEAAAASAQALPDIRNTHYDDSTIANHLQQMFFHNADGTNPAVSDNATSPTTSASLHLALEPLSSPPP